MELVIGKTAGFCFGVKNAVEKTLKELEKNQKVYCLGELVHNKQVIEELKQQGAIFINSIEEANKKVIIRAHGISKNTYLKAKELNLEVLDLTCPKVLHIHNIADEFSKKDYFIFLVGKKNHPETIGTISYCGNNSVIIESINDIQNAIKKYSESKLKKSIIIAQTTFSVDVFNNIAKKIKDLIKNVEVKNTICNATQQRQEETISIAKNVDMMIIVGGKNSSNTTKLYDISKTYCKKVILVEMAKEIDINILKNINTIGIMAGASTPQKSIQEVVDILSKT